MKLSEMLALNTWLEYKQFNDNCISDHLFGLCYLQS